MLRKILIGLALAVSAAGIAWAANAPVYTDATGIVRSTQGVVIVNPDGSMPVMGGAGGGGGGGGAVTGDVVSGAADTGTAPVKIGGVYNLTLPTFATGQRGDAQLDTNGNIRSRMIGITSAAADGTSNTITQPSQPSASTGFNLGVDNFIFNGTTWDRQRGDTTGLFVGGNTEDAIATANPSGNMTMLVRTDTLNPAEVSATGDNIAARATSKGEVYTHDTDVLAALAGVGGGTQYTEDAAAAANPVGTMNMAVRRDTLSTTEVSANGDNIAIGATSKGELRVNDNDVVALITASNGYLNTLATNSNDPNPASVTVVPTDPMIGPVNETPPATDIGVAGLNGRLQRVAQNQSSNANKGQTFTATLNIDTAPIASGELMNTTPATMTAFCPTATAVMEITNLKVHDADDQGVSLDAVVENAATSLGTQNNAPSQTNDTLGEAIVAVLPVDAADYFDYGGGKSAFVFPDRRLRFACNGTNTNMFLSAVVRGGATFAGGVLKFTFVMERVG